MESVCQMEKWIYKITNNINGKIYIGQTKNVKKRFKEHINAETNSAIHNAIKKYGKENFTFEIIEGPIKNYNEREIYWIEFYNSYRNGYNLTIGGNQPPTIMGEKSYFAKFSDDLILQLQLDLINTNLSYAELSDKYHIRVEYITKINIGSKRFNNNFNYPLRNNGNCIKKEDTVAKVTNALLNTTLSVEQISKNFDVSSKTVRKINLGLQANSFKNIDYPIREKGQRISKKMLSNIITDLLGDKLKLSDIEKKYNLSKTTINRINQGKILKRESLKYPLRPSDKRVYD